MGTTGPKISSWTSDDFCFTSSMTVGSRNHPCFGAEGFSPPMGNLVSFFFRFLDETHAGLSLLFADHRSKVRARFQRVPEPEIFCHTDERGNKLVLDLLINVHPFRADTGLATVPETSPYRTLQRPRNVCVMPDNERSLPTQL